MTLGRNDAAISPSFIDGLTLEGPIGHAGKISICSFVIFTFWNISSLLSYPWSSSNGYWTSDLIAARKLAYLTRLPTDEHRIRVGISWLAKSAIDSVASFQSTLARVLSGS